MEWISTERVEEHMGDTVQIMITMVVYMAAVIGIGIAFASILVSGCIS